MAKRKVYKTQRRVQKYIYNFESKVPFISNADNMIGDTHAHGTIHTMMDWKNNTFLPDQPSGQANTMGSKKNTVKKGT